MFSYALEHGCECDVKECDDRFATFHSPKEECLAYFTEWKQMNGK